MGTRTAPSTRHPLQPVLSICREYVTETFGLLRSAAFWSTVTLPWLLLAFVLTGRVLDHPVVFATLLVMNLTCGILGHNYGN